MVLNLQARWILFVAAIFWIGCVFSIAGPTQVEAADKPAKATEEAAESSKESTKEETGEQAADKPVVKVKSSNPFSGDPEAIASGRDLYFTWCVQCHGKKADGVSPRWGNYGKDLRKFWQGYSKFVLITIQGVKGKQMPPWGDVLSGNQISHIGAYLETLAMEGANWQ